MGKLLNTHNDLDNDQTAIISAFEMDENPFPSEVPYGSALWSLFTEGYEGYEQISHFGWPDLVKLQSSVKNGKITRLNIHGLDILGKAGDMNGCIKVCTGYIYNHKLIKYIPQDGFKDCKPLYDGNAFIVGGWDFKPNEIDDLPLKAKWYMRYLLTRVPNIKEVFYLDDNISVTAYFSGYKRVSFITKKQT